MSKQDPRFGRLESEDEFEQIQARYQDRAPLGPSYNELTRAVIGAAIQIHKTVGPGFLESYYQRAMAIELAHLGIPFSQQVKIPVSYRDQAIGESFLDLVIDDRLVVELKSVESLAPIHRKQTYSYLRAGGYQLGLLINFNVMLLREGVSRVINTPRL